MTVHTRTSARAEGFTLVELLVVMVILGILAGIAIPTLINQRKTAVDTSMKSDLRSAAVFVEAYQVDNEAYPAAWADIASDVETDSDTAFTLTLDAGDAAYCLVATRVAGAPPGTGVWSYDSDGGGLLADHAACS